MFSQPRAPSPPPPLRPPMPYGDPLARIRFAAIAEGLGGRGIRQILSVWLPGDAFSYGVMSCGQPDPRCPSVRLFVDLETGAFQRFATAKPIEFGRVAESEKQVISTGDLADLGCHLFGWTRAQALDELEKLLGERRRIGGLGYDAFTARRH